MPKSPVSPIALAAAVATAALVVAPPAGAWPRHRLRPSDVHARPRAGPTTHSPAAGGASQDRRAAPDGAGWDTIYSARGSLAPARGAPNAGPSSLSRAALPAAPPVALRPAARSD
jgi:hypothetical protein